MQRLAPHSYEAGLSRFQIASKEEFDRHTAIFFRQAIKSFDALLKVYIPDNKKLSLAVIRHRILICERCLEHPEEEVRDLAVNLFKN